MSRPIEEAVENVGLDALKELEEWAPFFSALFVLTHVISWLAVTVLLTLSALFALSEFATLMVMFA